LRYFTWLALACIRKLLKKIDRIKKRIEPQHGSILFLLYQNSASIEQANTANAASDAVGSASEAAPATR
jgi:hypothetical protein